MTYLLVDKKIRDSKKNLKPLKSRFGILTKFFQDKEFNRTNFTLFISSLRDRGYKSSYINGFIKLAKHYDKFVETNCIQDYTFFKEKYEDIERLTMEEVKRLAEYPYPYQRDKEYLNLRDFIVINLLYDTACRIGELEHLLWKDLHNEPVPYVVFRETKSGEDQKVVITKTLYDLLQTLPHNGKRVFDSKTGKMFSRTEFSKRLKERAALCGINKTIYPHIFRHSKLSHLTNIYGFPLSQVSKFARHKDPKTTMRYAEAELMEMLALAHASPFEKKENALKDIPKLVIRYMQRLYGASAIIKYNKVSDTQFTYTVDVE